MAATRLAGVITAAASLLFVLPIMLIIAIGSSSSTAGLLNGWGSAALRADAPIPAEFKQYILQAGTTCPEIGPALLAAQIDQESAWNPNAVSPDGAEGLAQFTPATWKDWGLDGDGDGTADPFQPADAIAAQGRYMCHLARWAQQNLDASTLTGDRTDLALAAYNCGKQCVTDTGKVPTAGEPAEYVTQIRAKMSLYATDTPEWTHPLPQGSYTLGSGFRTPERPHHDGIDLGAPNETPIRAAASGVVTAVLCNASTGNCDVPGSPSVQGCGWYVDIRHDGGIVTRYCHMIRKPTVREGQHVPAGHAIGSVGSSGNSSGPHLHFEVHTDVPNGQLATPATATDPQEFLSLRGVVL